MSDQYASGFNSFTPHVTDGGRFIVGGNVGNGPIAQDGGAASSGGSFAATVNLPISFPGTKLQLQNLDVVDLTNLRFASKEAALAHFDAMVAERTAQYEQMMAQAAQAGGALMNLEDFELMNLAVFPGTAKGNALASKGRQIAASRGTYGRCYAAVADAVDATIARFLSGNSAYMAADQLARSGYFTEKKVSASQLPQLPAGAIVVWGKTGPSPDGHISIALGNGQEASDHITSQLTSLRGYSNFRVFMPK